MTNRFKENNEWFKQKRENKFIINPGTGKFTLNVKSDTDTNIQIETSDAVNTIYVDETSTKKENDINIISCICISAGIVIIGIISSIFLLNKKRKRNSKSPKSLDLDLAEEFALHYNNDSIIQPLSKDTESSNIINNSFDINTLSPTIDYISTDISSTNLFNKKDNNNTLSSFISYNPTISYPFIDSSINTNQYDIVNQSSRIIYSDKDYDTQKVDVEKVNKVNRSNDNISLAYNSYNPSVEFSIIESNSNIYQSKVSNKYDQVIYTFIDYNIKKVDVEDNDKDSIISNDNHDTLTPPNNYYIPAIDCSTVNSSVNTYQPIPNQLNEIILSNTDKDNDSQKIDIKSVSIVNNTNENYNALPPYNNLTNEYAITNSSINTNQSIANQLNEIIHSNIVYDIKVPIQPQDDYYQSQDYYYYHHHQDDNCPSQKEYIKPVIPVQTVKDQLLESYYESLTSTKDQGFESCYELLRSHQAQSGETNIEPQTPLQNQANEIYIKPLIPIQNQSNEKYIKPLIPTQNQSDENYTKPLIPLQNQSDEVYIEPLIPLQNQPDETYNEPLIPIQNQIIEIIEP
ncbi:hypothetical protein BCR32DRAFT_269528 [Anaeromyces robustus]|uniref:Uncharacterized protein n=1 Tax=Anaeromyces robustus TaxID=1754192 RepID=A0A1Y1X1S6_9FUNG|nr:hypothetical protein BCR32DRAFT_269528 [Anaeromyces robustus]|eukprot:ORX79366.1 hypothetical protein BCR32DRAFT_269528 [Anaeromyces robustus]